MRDKKRVLVVSPTYPYPLVAGGKIRIYNLLRELSSEFSITLLTLVDDSPTPPESGVLLDFVDEVVAVPIHQLRWRQCMRLAGGFHRWLFGTPVEVLAKYSKQQRQLFLDLVRSGHFDAIQIEYSQLGDLLSFNEAQSIPSLLVAHDVAHASLLRRSAVKDGLAKLFWRHEAGLMKKWEERAWRKASKVIAVSANDSAQIQETVSGVAVDVVPNGVDLVKYSPVAESPQPTVVFTGWSRHAPNVDGLYWFLESIWERVRSACPEVRLQVIGAGFRPTVKMAARGLDDGVDFLGYVDEVAPYVGSAWCSIVPLRIGSGTRLKILEAMALGTPVVSTDIGCEGLELQPDAELLVADTEVEFAGAVIALLKDQGLRERLTATARARVEQSYSWPSIGELARKSLRDAIEAGSQ